MSGDLPGWARQLQQAAAGFNESLARAGHIMTAQAAMGWMVQGEFDKAREQIAKLPPEQRDILAMAARALADLTEENRP